MVSILGQLQYQKDFFDLCTYCLPSKLHAVPTPVTSEPYISFENESWQPAALISLRISPPHVHFLPKKQGNVYSGSHSVNVSRD